MALLVRVCIHTSGGENEREVEVEATDIQRGDAGCPVGPIKAVARSGHPCRVRVDVREPGTVLWVVRARVAGHREAQESHFARGKDRR